MKVNNKGLSVVELIVSFVLCILVFVFIIQVVSSVEELYINLGVKTELLSKQSIISEEMNNKFKDKKTTLIKSCGKDCLTFFYKDNTFEKMQIDKDKNNFVFGENIYNFNGLGFVDSLTVTVTDDRTYNQGILTINLNIKNSIFDNGKYIIKAYYQYSNGETVYSASTSDKPEIFLLGPAVSYKFSEDLFIEPGWIVYYPDGRITINSADVVPSNIEFDHDGNGFIRYRGVNEAAGVEKTRTIKNYETAKARILSLYDKSPTEGIYYYDGMGRYVYKGANPNNYITIGSKVFRIISLDIQSQYMLDEEGHVVVVDGEKQKETKYLLKVVSTDFIKNEDATESLPFSTAHFGDSLYNTSMWSKKVCTGSDCHIDKQYINTIVNDIYLQGLLNTGAGKLQIKNGTFNTGVVNWNQYHLSLYYADYPDEVSYRAKDIYDAEGADYAYFDWGTGTDVVEPGKWSGDCFDDVCEPNAGIVTLTDVLFAGGDPGCLDNVVVKNGVKCVQDNWLWKQKSNEADREQYRMMTRINLTGTWILTEQNYLSTDDITQSYRTRATLYLDADLYIMGSGTSENPYTLYTITK